MKRLMMAALIGGQLAMAAAPLRAAELIDAEQAGSRQQLGAFAGARLRMPLDGRSRERTRLALTAAPTLHMLQANGVRRARIGEGVELGGRGERLQLSYAGRPVSRLVAGGERPDGERRGISTIGWVAIGVGGLALLYVAAIGVCTEVTECFPGE